MPMKVLIVGGVAAGASAATRLRRLDENTEIIILEKGEHISFANCGLPYYVGDVINKRSKLLVQNPSSMRKRFNIQVRVKNEVLKVFPQEKEIEILDIPKGITYREKYDYLVLCPGAEPVIPNIPGIEQANVFTVRNVPDSDQVKQFIAEKQPSTALVIGGGFVGLEMVEVLHESGIKVNLVEAAPQVMGSLDPEMAGIIHQSLIKHGINLYLNEQVVALEGEGQVEAAILASGNKLPTDMVVMGIGVKPEAKLAREAGLAIGSTGGILVNEYLQTSDPSIYAAGDAVQVNDLVTGEAALVPLAGPANRQGWLVANNIAGNLCKYNGVQGTAIVKILDKVAAVTGKNEKTLRKLGWDVLSCHIHPSSHATYYPGSSELTIKLLFSPGDGKIFGAQIVGSDGVDKRIDVLATAIRAGMTVFDLQELELAYAPPFSSAKDPVNMVGYAAANIVKGKVEVIQWDQAMDRVNQGAFLIDARTPKEIEKFGQVEGAVNIPVDEIRDRLAEIPLNREIAVYCQVGLRSYIANRILCQHGYKVKNISGGFKLYKVFLKNN